MSLELKNHLAKYLNTGLKMKAPKGFIPNGKESTGVCGIVYLTGDLYADIENNTFKAKFKPILHPLSDLTKEIEHNGDKIVPIEEIRKEILTHFEYEDSDDVILVKFPSGVNHLVAINNEIVEECPLGIYQTLIKLHFDVFGLIEKGLAIDINTL